MKWCYTRVTCEKIQVSTNKTIFKTPIQIVFEVFTLLVVGMSDRKQPIYRDPWAKREAWRKHPVFDRRTQIRNMFPGFGIALIAFSGYVAWDNLSSPNSSTIHDLKKHSEDQIKQKDNLLGWVTGQDDKKADHK
ncbi:hypothetical protein H4Q26_002988 [Puccinia striiformis f. sp. tritici PST-130]|nr:hypothetical protein H4Q26_002988 [Puccinia striiformis f. sp. tritici PST-130]